MRNSVDFFTACGNAPEKLLKPLESRGSRHALFPRSAASTRCRPEKFETNLAVTGCSDVTTSTMETLMSKTDVKEIQKRAERQVEHTSDLGGTYFGQQPDGKTASVTSKEGPKARANDG
jgi:hypothetical protein